MSLRIAMAAVMVAASASIVGAVTLDSAPLGNASPRTLTCRVVNVGKKPIMVTARLLQSSGVNIATATSPACNAAIPLQPHATCTATLTGNISARCNVTSNSSKIRATLSLEVGGVPEVVVPATTK
jgi:hypothetical protein